MNRNKFDKFADEFVKLAEKYLDENDRVALFVRDIELNHIDFKGTDCSVCLSDTIQAGYEAGDIKHKEENDEKKKETQH